MVTIRDVRAIATAPDGRNLIVVKVETSEPGLYGLGCATFAYRVKSVVSVVEDYLKPLLVGRDVSRIEELWQLMNNNSYWRNGPITNNAISGVDIALWDIKGKMAGMPVYDLFGGKVRDGVAVYRHATGKTMEELMERVDSFVEDGLWHIRCQFNRYGAEQSAARAPENLSPGEYLDPGKYMRNTVHMFERLRDKYGYELEFLHDAHERLHPRQTIDFAREMQQFKLFFLEDLLSPEQGEYFRIIRNNCTTPLANGELYNNPKEWDYLIKERLIDFIRVHISQIGGLTPARKLAIFAEAFGVKTAWHGPGDVSPVGHAANVHLDYASHNMGIQEWMGINEPLLEVFPGSPELRRGYVYLNGRPGLGLDLDEEKAKKYPCNNGVVTWTQTRMPDGTPWTP